MDNNFFTATTDFVSSHSLVFAPIFALLAVFWFITMVTLRRVVSPNEVHIVQYRRKTISYGKGSAHGNVYYEWPTWVPLFGITKTELPVSVFKIELKNYEAYDADKVPFEVDVVAFFRIEDSNMTAARASSFQDLNEQMTYVVRGAVRTVLASHPIDKIMLERSTFGEAFTKEVHDQLPNWGVVTVKNIELMDIRDGAGNKVVHNIMQKKQSFIEMESRTAVAQNQRDASIAEIHAQRDAEVQKELSSQAIGTQAATREQEVGIAKQKASQAIKEQEKATATKTMEVKRVEEVTRAEINKAVAITSADQQKQSAVLLAEGSLQSAKLAAEGVAVQGKAKGEAEQAILMAPVNAQITLAKEIGSNAEYQQYLLTLETIKAGQAVGIEQAHALTEADVKIIANAGDPVSGVTHVMDLFNAKGGTAIAGMIEAIGQTENGKKIVDKLTEPKGKK